MKVAGGLAENGVIIGNTFDKYGSSNRIVRHMVDGFTRTLNGWVDALSPESIHEVGCGEGYWVVQWAGRGIAARGSDFSSQVIRMARDNAVRNGLSPDLFEVRSIYDVASGRDEAELVVCCEVFEHIEDPEAALKALQRIVGRDLILSVPREPLWRALNLARGRYVANLGNTPGHIQHWSRAKIVSLVGRYFDVVEVASPLPWTMLRCTKKATPAA
ncbi:class I SAM-dependent methyltransferase [Pararhizobium mangrovi]|uniref:Class I SAM-dependent methyltransferase n=1 Tax=Pararhizobium mangrovi TaxID=2590452 RepID=A0A506U9I0_9HYPH|nr:class I SAM-dependent methyltransferase [Pararhizobium mangrovi]TPW29615.1 class I SAM-dependent methyltransferase [Pararhizobium mangrovi]